MNRWEKSFDLDGDGFLNPNERNYMYDEENINLFDDEDDDFNSEFGLDDDEDDDFKIEFGLDDDDEFDFNSEFGLDDDEW